MQLSDNIVCASFTQSFTSSKCWDVSCFPGRKVGSVCVGLQETGTMALISNLHNSLVDNNNRISTHIVRRTGSTSRCFSGGMNCNVAGKRSISCIGASANPPLSRITSACRTLLTSISYSSPPINGPSTAGRTSTPLTTLLSPTSLSTCSRSSSSSVPLPSPSASRFCPAKTPSAATLAVGGNRTLSSSLASRKAWHARSRAMFLIQPKAPPRRMVSG